MPHYFGSHVSASGGLENAVKTAKELGVNTIQLHPSPPQKWNSKPFAGGAEDKFLTEREGSGVEKVFFHGIYLINLATPDSSKFHLAKLSLVHYLDLNARIDGSGVIFHVGSLKDEPDEKKGYARAASAINWILEQANNKAKLILEVAAGSGNIIGDRMEELAAIYEQVEDKERVGFGLDSQHMWASGYDLVGEFDSIVEEIDRVFGLQKVWAIHLNDSKTERGSKKDRHENLGDGTIGLPTITRIFTHKKLATIPFVLETPAVKEMEGAKREIGKLRAMMG